MDSLVALFLPTFDALSVHDIKLSKGPSSFALFISMFSVSRYSQIVNIKGEGAECKFLFCSLPIPSPLSSLHGLLHHPVRMVDGWWSDEPLLYTGVLFGNKFSFNISL